MAPYRIGLISDIHGNNPCLEIALASLDREQVDEIVCLGDVANLGPWPGEVINRLRDRAIPTVLGNADAWLTEATSHLAEAPNSLATIGITSWTREKLNDNQLGWIGDLPLVIRRQVGVCEVMFCHGSPNSIDDVLAAHTPDEVLDEWLSHGQRIAVINGHTHVALQRRHGAGTLVNPGSVGLPGAGPDDPELDQNADVDWIEFAILGVDEDEVVGDLHRIEVDVARLIEDATRTEMPYLEWWKACWKQN